MVIGLIKGVLNHADGMKPISVLVSSYMAYKVSTCQGNAFVLK